LRGSTRKRQKNSDDRSKKKKKRNLAKNYYTDEKGKGMKGREKRDGTKIGVNKRIPWDKKS